MELERKITEYNTKAKVLETSLYNERERITQLEADLTESRKILHEEESHAELLQHQREGYITSTLDDVATRLEARNRSNGVPYTSEQRDKDARLITIYEADTDLFEDVPGMQERYAVAQERQQQTSSLVCPIVVQPNGNVTDVYIPVHYNRQEEGLMEGLVDLVQTALLQPEIQFTNPEDRNGIIYLSLKEGEEQFVTALQNTSPAGYDELNIEVKVVRPGVTDIFSSVKTIYPEDLSHSIADRLQWITVREASAMTGRTTSYIRCNKLLDYQGGPIKTMDHSDARRIDVNSLASYLSSQFDGFEILTTTQAAERLHTQALDLLGNSVGIESYRGRLGASISQGRLNGIKVGKSRLLSTLELKRYSLPHFAKKRAISTGDGMYSLPEVIEMLGLSSTSSINNMVRGNKLERGRPGFGEITAKSIVEFVKKNRYTGSNWKSKNA